MNVSILKEDDIRIKRSRNDNQHAHTHAHFPLWVWGGVNFNKSAHTQTTHYFYSFKKDFVVKKELNWRANGPRFQFFITETTRSNARRASAEGGGVT